MTRNRTSWKSFAAMAAAGLGLQACVTTTWSMPTASRLVELGIVEGEADLDALDRGRVSAIIDCRECHRQYWPQEVNAKRWPALGREMGQRASMTEKEIEDLIAYMAHASQTSDFAGIEPGNEPSQTMPTVDSP